MGRGLHLKSSDETVVEKVLGSASAKAIAAVVASTAAGPLGALLPVLVDSIPNKRFQARVDRRVQELQLLLLAHKDKLDKLEDAQYNLLNDVLSATLHTVSEQKLTYLRNAALNCLDSAPNDDYKAVVLGRIIRDVSVDEIRFLMGFSGRQILKASRIGPHQEGKVVIINTTAPDSLQVDSLVNLGLLTASHGSSPGGVEYFYTTWAYDLLRLIESPSGAE